MGLKKFKIMSTQRKNLFRFTGKTETFKIVHKTTDMQDNPYILKFRDCQGQEFFLMYSDFYTQINKGKIEFAP